MGEFKSEVSDYFDKYAAKADRKEERLLRKQRRDGVRECKRIQGLLRRKKLAFRRELKDIEEKMIPYIKRMKWMPWSYRHMLIAWEERYYDMGGKK